MHYLGRQQWVQQFRSNGTEIDLFASDLSYDFNSQKFSPRNKEILPGDTLRTHCVWDSSSRDLVTVGGEETDQEMCLSAVIYYPRIPKFSGCITSFTNGNECNYPC